MNFAGWRKTFARHLGGWSTRFATSRQLTSTRRISVRSVVGAREAYESLSVHFKRPRRVPAVCDGGRRRAQASRESLKVASLPAEDPGVVVAEMLWRREG